MSTPLPPPPGWDPIARDSSGAPLSAGELCGRDACWHRWIDHDHITALDGPGFGRCTVTAGTRCSCPGFVTAASPTVVTGPFAVPFPTEPVRCGAG